MSLESEINKHITHKLEQERDMYKRNWDKTLKERDTLIDDIAVLKANISRLEQIRDIKDSALKGADIKIKTLERENEQRKKEQKVNRTKASLLTEIEQFKEKAERSQCEVLRLERENERLLNQSNYYARHNELAQERLKQLLPKEHNYVVLTSHIRQKAEANPGVSRYIDLVNYIDRLEQK